MSNVGITAALRIPRRGKKGTGPGEFHAPIGLAVTAAGEVLVADFQNGRVQKFTAKGKFLGRLPVSPCPGGIAVDRAGNVYISHFPAFSAADPVSTTQTKVSDIPQGSTCRCTESVRVISGRQRV